MSSPYRRAALESSLDGSAMCGAPRSWTHTSRSGQRRTSVPAPPAWSRWMWVIASARGRSPVQRLEHGVDRGRRAGIDEHAVDQPGADHVLVSLVERIDETHGHLPYGAMSDHRLP